MYNNKVGMEFGKQSVVLFLFLRFPSLHLWDAIAFEKLFSLTFMIAAEYAGKHKVSE